jgi:hypothetical protein
MYCIKIILPLAHIFYWKGKTYGVCVPPPPPGIPWNLIWTACQYMPFHFSSVTRHQHYQQGSIQSHEVRVRLHLSHGKNEHRSFPTRPPSNSITSFSEKYFICVCVWLFQCISSPKRFRGWSSFSSLVNTVFSFPYNCSGKCNSETMR